MRRRYDFLVIGSGIAGLSFALKVADKGSVCIISKTNLDETNTRYAQGGIAAVTYSPDTHEKHVSDTIIAGAGLCNEEVVKMVVNEGPDQIQELINWGTSFDKKENGMFDLNKEGGHSEERVLHHKDNTGFEIQRALTSRVLAHSNITALDKYFALDLISQHHQGDKVTRSEGGIECYGAYALNLRNNEIDTVLAKSTFIATGGAGNIYQTTTNPNIATGDGIAMAYRIKAVIENMEFVQFHPTSLFNPGERPSFLITEALRGFGAVLRNAHREEFMHKYDKRESLAPRDIVARAIDHERKALGSDYVYLDATHIDGEKLKDHFPNIYSKCEELGIDINKDLIPVVTAAHYFCGGIKVDDKGRTSVKYLYAAGECSSTGLHGANRLASNSLLEAVVFADKAAKDSIKMLSEIQFVDEIPSWDVEGTSHQEEMVLITQNMKELQQIMSNYVGIVRSNLRLKRAHDRLEIIYRETEELYKKSILSQKICELRNSINVAYLVIKMASKRKESRGLHCTVDYPEKILDN